MRGDTKQLTLVIKRGNEVYEYSNGYYLTIKETPIAHNDDMNVLKDMAMDILTALYNYAIDVQILVSVDALANYLACLNAKRNSEGEKRLSTVNE